MTTSELLQERRDFEEQRRQDIRDYDEVDGQPQHEGSLGVYDEFAYDMTSSTCGAWNPQYSGG